MPTTNPVTIKIIAGTLPVGAVYNAQTYFNAIVNNMTAQITSDQILWGQIGGSQPTGQLGGGGLWFGTAIGGDPYWNWWDVDQGQYMPINLVVGEIQGGTLKTTTILSGAVTRNWQISTPDNGGVIALTSDLLQMAGQTNTPPAATVTIDWSNPQPVFIVQNQNMVINHINTAQNGMMMDLWLENNSKNTATTYTISSPTVWWPNGTAPTLSAGVAGANVVDHIRFTYIGGAILGELISKGLHA